MSDSTVKYLAAAVIGHQYLLSKFEAFPLACRQRDELRFTLALPKATSFREAVNAALRAEGLDVPDGYVEATKEEVHYINTVKNFFVRANPETVMDDNPKGGYTVLWAYGCNVSFQVQKGASIVDVLASRYAYEAPTAIAGLRLTPDDLYCNMHTALRKNADSKITSAAWNAMHTVNADARSWLVKLVLAALNAQAVTTVEEVVAAVKKHILDDHTYQGKPDRALLHCLFELFTDDDWCGMLSYVMIWPWEVKQDAA